MATYTIYPSSWTSITSQFPTQTTTGGSQARTGYRFATMSSSTSSNIYLDAAILRFERPQALKYAKITAASLTWKLDGYMFGGGAGNNYTIDKSYIASYKTEANLNQISYSNYHSMGTQGTWVQLTNSSGAEETPWVRTTPVTALYNGNLSDSEFNIVICAGYGSQYRPATGTYNMYTWIVPANCYLTVTYEQGTQPAPTPLYPRDTNILEADKTLFSWQFNSETAAIQKAARLEWKNVEDDNYTIVNLTQSETTYTLNTHLPVGSYQWRLRVTNDADIQSDYSVVAYFNVIGKPAAPIINEPDNKTLTTITWNTTDQQSYEIMLQDQSGKELLHDSVADGEASYKPNVFLKGDYLVSIRVMNSSQMWSEWSQRAFTISATGPDPAVFTIISAAGDPAVRIAYTLPEDVQAVLMRSENGNEKILAELADLEGEYADDTAASDVEYQYYVRTYDAGYTDTTTKSATLHFEGAILKADGEFLHLISSDEPFLPYQEIREREYAAMNFSGREYAVVERGEHTNVEFTRKFFVSQKDKPTLDDLCVKEEVFYRDTKKNAFPVAITRVQYDAFQGDGYILTLYFIRIHEEEVLVNV